MPEERKYTLSELKSLSKIIKNDPDASGTPSGMNWHGPLADGSGNFGILSGSGRPGMYSAAVRPSTFLAALATKPSVYTDQILDLVMGVLPAAGTNAETWCDPGPTPGQMKTCSQKFIWGKFKGQTDLEAIPDIGELRNRADVPREILNSPPRNFPFFPELLWTLTDTQSRLQADFWRFGWAMERATARVGINGNHATAYTGTEWGWTKEFDGLTQLITTGHVDVETETECPGMDSVVVDWNESEIEDSVGGGDPRDFSQTLVDTVFSLTDRGMSMGYDGLQLVAIIRPELFRALVYVLACDYSAFRCGGGLGKAALDAIAASGFNTGEQRQLQSDMVRRRYLWVDNYELPVLFDNGLLLASQGGATYQSDLLITPLRFVGGDLTYLEYFPLDNPYAAEWGGFQGEAPRALNNGMYMMGNRSTDLCKSYTLAAKMRLILETPFLAGRIDNITFTTRTQTRNTYYDESFYANGGDTFIDGTLTEIQR